MDIVLLKVGDLIEIFPDHGTTVTAYSRAEKTENIGKLNKGEVYKVHKISVDKGMIELESEAWPPSLHPVPWGGVWVDPRFVKAPGIDPVPVPVPNADWKVLVRELAKTVLRVLGE